MNDQTPLPPLLTADEPMLRQRLVVKIPSVEPRLVYGLIGVLAVIHVYTVTLSRVSPFPVSEFVQFYSDYANNASAVADGQSYRLLTSMFLHADWMHLIFNCLALYVFGKDIESLFGAVRFALIYFLGGLAGSVASFVVTQGNSIGASGAVFAVFGALVAYYYQNRHLYGASAYARLRQLGSVALVNLIIGFLTSVPGSPIQIDNAAHIGGAVGGLVLAWFMTPIFMLDKQWVGGQWQASIIDTKKPAQWIIAPLVFSGFLVVIALVTISARA